MSTKYYFLETQSPPPLLLPESCVLSLCLNKVIPSNAIAWSWVLEVDHISAASDFLLLFEPESNLDFIVLRLDISFWLTLNQCQPEVVVHVQKRISDGSALPSHLSLSNCYTALFGDTLVHPAHAAMAPFHPILDTSLKAVPADTGTFPVLVTDMFGWPISHNL